MSNPRIDKEYPLYPQLSEAGKIEAEQIIEGFKKKLINACEDALSRVYTCIPAYIESDSWQNFRNDVVDGFTDYSWSRVKHQYDFKALRETIYAEHRDALIEDLNKDNIEKIEALQKEVSHLLEMLKSMER